MGSRPPRRGAGPREHQGRVAGLRADRGEGGLPLLRPRGRGLRRLARRAARALRRGRLHVRRPDRPAARDPRRGPARIVAGHGLRRLVQRPSRLPGPPVRPRRRAGRRGRQRQRRDRLRADALADPGGARSHGHRRRCGDGDRRVADPRDRDARPARAGPGRVHAARGPGAASLPARTSRSTRTTWCSTRRASGRSRRPRPRPPERRAPPRVRGPRAGRQAEGPRLRFLVSPVAILGEDRVEAVEVVHNELVEDGHGRDLRGSHRPCGGDPPAGSSSAALATAASASRACRSTSAVA